MGQCVADTTFQSRLIHSEARTEEAHLGLVHVCIAESCKLTLFIYSLIESFNYISFTLRRHQLTVELSHQPILVCCAGMIR
jgi:hypothetical protein